MSPALASHPAQNLKVTPLPPMVSHSQSMAGITDSTSSTSSTSHLSHLCHSGLSHLPIATSWSNWSSSSYSCLLLIQSLLSSQWYFKTINLVKSVFCIKPLSGPHGLPDQCHMSPATSSDLSHATFPLAVYTPVTSHPVTNASFNSLIVAHSSFLWDSPQCLLAWNTPPALPNNTPGSGCSFRCQLSLFQGYLAWPS